MQSRFCPNCGRARTAASTEVQAPDRRSFVSPAQSVDVASHQSIFQVDTAFQPIKAGTVTGGGASAVSNTDERIIWGDKPSLALLFGLVIKYALVLMISLYITVSFPNSNFIPYVLALAVVHIGLRAWGLYSTSYRLSSQRLEVTAGLFSQATVAYELHLMGNSQIHRSLILRMIQRGDLHLSNPNLVLRAISKPEAVRDLIRNLGQREAQRMDKIRWR